MQITIHNAKKCTFDGRDLFIVCLLSGGSLAYDKKAERYFDDATSEHSTLEEAKEYAKQLSKKYGGLKIFVEGQVGPLSSHTDCG